MFAKPKRQRRCLGNLQVQLTCDLGKKMVFPKDVLCSCKHVELFSVDYCEILMFLFFHKVGGFPPFIEVFLPVLGVQNGRASLGFRQKKSKV